jgi:tetratricopeptide (TPR) repeat protein
MAAKRLLRSISLFRLTVLVYLLEAGLAALFWEDLRWAGEALPGYFEGSIASPRERQLYVEARHIILEQENLEPARALLEESIAIDPYGEGRYWLGRYFFELRQDEEAQRQFEQYLEIDPTMLDTYLKLAAIHAGRQEPALAQEVLNRGIAHFEQRLDLYQPQDNPAVDQVYNSASWEVYRQSQRALRTLRDLLLELATTP